MQGARVDAEFQSRLRVMDIDEVDLQQLFEMSLSGACNACHFFKTITHTDTTSANSFSIQQYVWYRFLYLSRNLGKIPCQPLVSFSKSVFY